MKVRTLNPATEEILREYEIPSEEQLLRMTKKAEEAFKTEWRLLGNNNGNKRADYMYGFASQLRKEREKLATIATNEMGKAIKESRSEFCYFRTLRRYCKHYAMELSILAGPEICSSFSHGRKHNCA
jgi:acyl-CoA reductase-like NAD-dependent aldehyde dehydrogenase